MKKEDIENDLTEATQSLLKMARELCWNKFPDKCLYVLYEIKDGFDFKEQLIRKETLVRNQIPKSLHELLPTLEELYPLFHDVNLFINNIKKDHTLVEIAWCSRLSLDPEYRKTIEGQNTMLHCKVNMPPYAEKGKKFDIRWAHKPFKDRWRRFWWWQKIKRTH